MFFTADDGVAGTELYVSDATSAGTTRVADFNLGAAGSSPSNLNALGDRVLFNGVNGARFYSSDGTNISQINASNASSLVVYAGKVYFAASDPAHLGGQPALA